MVAESLVTFDGHTYEPGETIPDLGSMIATSVDGNIRYYKGLSTDFEKLKSASQTDKYRDLGTDSTAYLIDTVELYKYEATTGQWYEQ